jgi:hypothetical protein
MTTNGLSRWSLRFLAALALATGACDAPGSDDQYDQSSIPATAEDLADIDMTPSALTTAVVHGQDPRERGRWTEDFEGYPAGSSVSNYYWTTLGNSSLTITKDQAGKGKQSFKLSVTNDKAFKVNRAASAMCAPWGTATKLTANFRVRFSAFGSWNMIGITDNPRMAAWWWIGPEGGLREGNFSLANPKPAMTILKANTWYDVTIVVNLQKDKARIRFGSFNKTISLSQTFGTIAVPIECVRMISGMNVDQNVFVDSIMIRDRDIDEDGE